MTRVALAFVSSLAVCALGAPLAAQTRTLAETPIGQRVQLAIRDSLRQAPLSSRQQLVVGHFVRASADSVWIRPQGASEMGVARDKIRFASQSRGASRTRSALVMGGVWAAAAAVYIALDQSDDIKANRDKYLIGGTTVTFGIGALLGAISPFEHWRRVRP